MSRYTFLFIIFILAGYNTSAQGEKFIIDNEVNPGEVLMEFDNRPTDIKGTYYLNEEWGKGNISLSSGVAINNQWIRYDLKQEMLEIKLKEQVKVVPLSNLGEFELIKKSGIEKYSNCSRYSFKDGTELSGICRILANGFYGALIRYDYLIKKADYVPALDMGSREDEIIIKKTIFLTKNDQVDELPGRKKDFYGFFDLPDSEIRPYIRENRLNYKNETDLVKIVTHVNAISQ